MRSTRKTWNEKLHHSKAHKVCRLDQAFADLPAGCQMLIASPLLVDAFLRTIPRGKSVSVREMRASLARDHKAEHTCPLTTGIFLRIAAEAAWERFQAGESLTKVAAFWRVVEPGSPLAKKLTCGMEFIKQQRRLEGIA